MAQIRKYVVHFNKEPYDVYIGRPSEWGNPFSSKEGTLAEYKVATKAEAISEYEKWVISQPEMLEKIRKELKGKVLGCWCKPGACHGDVLARIANALVFNPPKK